MTGSAASSSLDVHLYNLHTRLQYYKREEEIKKNDIFRVIRKNITLVNLVLLLENVSFWLNLLSRELQV